MNKTITIYELLGLIKEGKAPKTIYYEGATYRLINNGMYDWYQNIRENDNSSFLDNVFKLKDFLNDTVEILDKEDKRIEKINFMTAETQKEKNRIMKDAINSLIDAVNSIGDKDVKD